MCIKPTKVMVQPHPLTKFKDTESLSRERIRAILEVEEIHNPCTVMHKEVAELRSTQCVKA